MKILIGFECSGVSRRRFRAAGHECYSCDIKAATDGETKYHWQCDILEAIVSNQWDLIILHPECTALCVSGNHVYAKGNAKHHMRIEAVTYTTTVWNLAKIKSKRVALENPVGVLTTQGNFPKPQRIQPYQFGEDASKQTLLFLHDLPPLTIHPELRVPGRMVNGKERWANQTDSGQNRLGPSEDRASKRAETYGGIADAFVRDWGSLAA